MTAEWRIVRCMADERQTHGWRVTIETEADDGTGITLSRDVPDGSSVPATIANGIGLARIGASREADGSHPDVADSGAPTFAAKWAAKWAAGQRPGEASWLRDPEPVADSGVLIGGEFIRAGTPRFEEVMDRAVGRMTGEGVRLHMAVCRCPGTRPCEPHTGKANGSGCEVHSTLGYGEAQPAELEPVEPEKVSSILNAWDAGWRPTDGPQPVEPDELARDRAEQLVTALAVSIRARELRADEYRADEYRNADTIARDLLAHPWVRKALEPAEAIVFADPLGTIVSFSYPDSVTPTKATHVRVRLEEGVVVGSGDIGRQVAVVK